MKAVILAGGMGTRLAPYTTILPKPLVPIGDRPILEIIVRQLAQAGIHEILLSTGYLGELIEAYFKNGHARLPELDMKYFQESEPLGTAGPLALIPGLNETFLAMNGDVLTTLNYAKLLDFHRRREAALTIATRQKTVQIDLGVLETDGQGSLVAYSEKPRYEFNVSMGIYIYQPHVISYIDRGEHLDFPELVVRLLEAGEKVAGFPSNDYWLDIGRREDYELALQEIQSGSFPFQECALAHSTS